MPNSNSSLGSEVLTVRVAKAGDLIMFEDDGDLAREPNPVSAA
jgi:hypothetical protein